MEILTARPRRLDAELIRRVGLHIRENERCMVLVPSQETLRTELLLMEGLSLPGSFLIDVLSPGRLPERIFERAGRPARADSAMACHVLEVIDGIIESDRRGAFVDIASGFERPAPLAVPAEGEESSLR